MDFVFLNLYARLRRQRPGLITGSLFLEKYFWLNLNIFEAVMTDRKRGQKANARAGVVLMLNSIQRLGVHPRGRFVLNYFPQGWPALYESWNLAFVVGNLINHHILLPKLLMPCLLNADPERYLFLRGVSLWTTINFQLFARTAGHAVLIPNHEAIATRWGEINGRQPVVDTSRAPVV
jgi:hypothetical protein